MFRSKTQRQWAARERADDPKAVEGRRPARYEGKSDAEVAATSSAGAVRSSAARRNARPSGGACTVALPLTMPSQLREDTHHGQHHQGRP